MIDVYVAVVGQLVLAAGLVGWALWRNRRDRAGGSDETDPGREARG